MADKLQALVGLFIKRRLKKDVLTDLPDKFENVLTVKLEGEQRKLYAAHEQRLRATLTKASDADFNTKKIRILAEFTLLREICCDPRLVYADAKNASAKLDAIVELVATCMDEGKKGPRVLAIHLVPRTHRYQTRRTRRGILHHHRRDAEETPCGTGRRIQRQ